VQTLCKSAMYLKAGQIVDIGRTDKVINNYLSREVKNNLSRVWAHGEDSGSDYIEMRSAKVIVRNAIHNNDNITVSSALDLEFKFVVKKPLQLNLSLLLYTVTGNCIFNVVTASTVINEGEHTSILKIPSRLLNDDLYTVQLLFVKDTTTWVHSIDNIVSFEVSDEQRQGAWYGKWLGAIRPTLDFSLD
jgi:lipopolysaccharide transport system ATP-binding protein